MAIGLTVTKPFAEKCRSLCALIGNCVHAKVMAAFLDTNTQHDALIQFAYILVDLCSWSIPENRMEMKQMVLCSKCLNWHKWEIKN